MQINWNNIDTVLLDMDGTLLDRHFDDHFWLEHVPSRWAARNGKDLAFAREHLYALFRSQENTLNWTDLDYWSDRLNLDIPLLKKEVEHLIDVHPFVIEFLLFLKHHRKTVWLVTNAHSKTLDLKMKKTKLGPYFDGIVSAHQVGLPKEDSGFWPALQDFIPYSPERTMLGEDSEANLLTAASYAIGYLVYVGRFSSTARPQTSRRFATIHYFNQLIPADNDMTVSIKEKDGYLMKVLLFLILLLVSTHASATDQELHLGRFSTKDLTGWKEQTIGLMKNKTAYSLSRDADRDVLVARSSKSASGRIYALKLDPKEYPTLKWSWKVDHTIKKGDEKTKDGDDYAARVYVVFPRGFFSKTRAICYVWANRLPKGEHVVSPFTSNIITVAADSGEELAGHWTFHQRNIYEDYRNFFGEEPPRIGAVALMTDTDNTGESAVGYYGDISLVRSPKAIEAKPKDQKTKEVPLKDFKHKEQSPKGTKVNGEAPLPSPDIPAPEKTPEDPKHRVPDSKEQPPGTTSTEPAAAPHPAVAP